MRKADEFNYMKYINKYELVGFLFIALLPLYVFWGYLSGKTSPPWDFFGDYYTQAYSWWDLGSFFSPTPYLPYLVSGFPSHLGLQVSSFYLPVGLIAEFSEYTILNAARLQAITISIGLVGVFFLSKKFDLNLISRIQVSVGYFFSAGFFSNASHIDIVRAWSFFPWLLLIMFPINKIKYFTIPIISLIWFQFFVGAYPGNLASFAYLLSMFTIILIWIFKYKFLDLLKWYSLTIIPGVLLSSIKWIPFLLTGNGPVIGNQVKVNLGIFSTLFFPYGGTGQSGDVFLPNDLTQRTFFIIPLVLMLSFLAYKNKKVIFTGLAFVITSVILGVDFDLLTKWQENLPLLEISRFRTIDFKPGISLGLALLAGAGFQNLIKFNLYKSDFNQRLLIFIKLFFAFSLAFLILLIGKSYDFTHSDNRFTLTIVLVSTFMIIILLLAPVKLKNIASLLALLSSIYIGISWANYFKDPWQVPRVGTENLYFGSEVSEIIKTKKPLESSSREKRVGPTLPIPYPGEMIIQFWNSNELRRTYSTGGYVTIKGEPNFNKYVEYALDPKYSLVIKFLEKESNLIFLDSKVLSVDNCIANSSCVEYKLKYQFKKYSPGKIIVEVEPLSQNLKIGINEIGWRGWQVITCNINNECKESEAANQEADLILNATIPSKTSLIKFEYKTPYSTQAWILFYSSLIVIFIIITYQLSKNQKVEH